MVTQSQSLTTESLSQHVMNDLVSVKLCKCVVCCVDFNSVNGHSACFHRKLLHGITRVRIHNPGKPSCGNTSDTDY